MTCNMENCRKMETCIGPKEDEVLRFGQDGQIPYVLQDFIPFRAADQKGRRRFSLHVKERRDRSFPPLLLSQFCPWPFRASGFQRRSSPNCILIILSLLRRSSVSFRVVVPPGHNQKFEPLIGIRIRSN